MEVTAAHSTTPVETVTCGRKRPLWAVATLCLLLLPLVGCDIITRSPMPVKFEVGTSKVGNGRRVTLTNESNRNLDVQVTQERLKEVIKEGEFTIQAGQTVEIGWLGGWRFVALDVVRVEHEDYIPIAEQLK